MIRLLSKNSVERFTIFGLSLPGVHANLLCIVTSLALPKKYLPVEIPAP